MTDTWPITLPQCFLVGYSETPGDGLIEYQPEAGGPPITRRRFSAVTRHLNGQMKMTRAQIGLLREFLDDTIIGGSLPFSFPDPTDTGETLLVKFAKGSLPSWQQIGGGVFRVNVQLTVLPS